MFIKKTAKGNKMTKQVIFRRLFVEDLLDMDDNRVSGYVYLTEGQEKP